MNDIKTQESKKLKELNLILDEIKEIGNLSGILLSYRDGELISDKFEEEIDIKTFAAMSASVIGSAEGLGTTIGERKIGKIITELDERTIIIVGYGERIVLTLVVADESKVNIILKELDDYLQKIIKVYLD